MAAGACAYAPTAKRPAIKAARILFIWNFLNNVIGKKYPELLGGPTVTEPVHKPLTDAPKFFCPMVLRLEFRGFYLTAESGVPC